MRLAVQTLDGHDLTTDFIMRIRRPYYLNPITSQWSARGGNNFDYFAGIQSGHGYIVIEFYVVGEPWRSKKDELQGWLSDERETPKPITVLDLDEPGLEWEIEVVAETGALPNARKFAITFSLTRDEWPFWKTSDPINEEWDVSASGQTFAFDVAGNHSGSKPVISIVPNVGKTNGFAYKIWRPVFNPTDSPWRNMPYDLAEDVAGTVAFNSAALINNTAKSNQIANVGGYNSSALSFVIDTPVGGGLATGGGMLYIAATGEQIYYTDITAGVLTVYDDGDGTTGRGWGGSTASAILDNAVMTESLMLKNGNDLRVVDKNGNEIDCWPQKINTTQTPIWINVTCEDRIQLTLNQAIAGSGAVSSLKVKQNSTNLRALKELPASYMVLINDEPFIANPVAVGNGNRRSVDLANYKLLGLQRVYSKFGESIAAHTVGTSINYVPIYFWIVYGNPFADAQVVDDTKKPMIDMENSTNLHWKWNSTSGFRDEASLRTAQVRLNIISTTSKRPVTSQIYTATHVGDADPATVAGIALVNFFKNNRWQVENAQASIDFPVHPAGYSNIVITAEKRRVSTSWVKVAAIRKSVDGKNWIRVWNEPTPAGTSFITFTTLSASLGSSPINTHVQFYVNGSIAASADNENDFEIQTADMTVISARILSGKMRQVMGNYQFNLALTHQESDATILVSTVFEIGDVLVIDCALQKVYRLDDKKPIPIGPGSRFPVLNKDTNTFLYEDPGTTDVTVDFDYYGYAWI